jgi:hypothetical protein
LEIKDFHTSELTNDKEKIISELELKNYNTIASEYIISNQLEKANQLICKYDEILK